MILQRLVGELLRRHPGLAYDRDRGPLSKCHRRCLGGAELEGFLRHVCEQLVCLVELAGK